MKRQTIFYIALFCLISLLTFSESPEKTSNQHRSKTPLKQILDQYRKSHDVKLVYSDNLIRDIKVEVDSVDKLNESKLANLLSSFDIAIRNFGDKTIVLFKSDVEISEPIFEKVITAQEVSEEDTLGFRIKPILLSNPVPPYPREAVKKGIEGSVRVKFLIGKNGSVSNSVVLATSGYSILDSAAKDFVYTLKYSPAEKDGMPHSTWMSMLFRYTLSKD